MGIYYFAVDYERELQMWAPEDYADKTPGVFYPGHPLPCMIIMKNIQGFNFQIINDVSSYSEHEFEDITDYVFNELKEKFPEYKWEEDK